MNWTSHYAVSRLAERHGLRQSAGAWVSHREHSSVFHCALTSGALLLTATLILAATSGVMFAAEAVSKLPNFIFILADDLGWSDLGCYGYAQLKTPNIDRLAREGTLFTQFYVNASVCSPSRCAFMTGQYPARHKIHGHYAEHKVNASRGMNDWLDPHVPNVAALLHKAGYATAHFGKWHLGNNEGAPSPSEYGFDETRTVNSIGPGWEEPDLTFRAKSSTAIVDETLRFITAHKNQPFYINAWMLIPHAVVVD